MKNITSFSIKFFVVFMAFFAIALPFARAQYYYPYSNYNTTNYTTTAWQYQYQMPTEYYYGMPSYEYSFGGTYPSYNYNHGYYSYTPSYQYQPYSWNYGYSYDYGNPYVGYYGSSSSSHDDTPTVDTKSARNITDDSAQLRGEVDMEDFRNGRVFFVYGEDKNDVEDVEDEDSYNDVDEQGDDLQKVLIESDLDGDEEYSRTVYGLDDDTRIYFRICVEYEDNDDDDTLECGSVENFRTDD